VSPRLTGRTITVAAAVPVLLAALGARLMFELGAEVPLTARGAPLVFGDRRLLRDPSPEVPLDSIGRDAAQTVALETLLRLATEDSGGSGTGTYCAGTLAGYTISAVPPAVLEAVRGRNPRVVDATRCRLHLETLRVDRPGVWPRRAWALWTTAPRLSTGEQVWLDMGYHAGPLHGAGWRCFLSLRDGRWVADSVTAMWQS
jgi:hypothetical protein